jgi:hypothetical protein
MKNLVKYLSLSIVLITFGCTDIIDLKSESNISVENFYTNYSDLQIGLTSCYRGMQAPLSDEWALSELRSDNTIMDSGTSTSTVKHDLSFLDQFYPPTTHQGVYNYWLKTYNNIRNTNIVLNAAGANYNSDSGVIEYAPVTIPVTLAQCKSIAAEASFIRAYHYFNLVRLYGGVFLIHEPITPEEAKTVNRTSVDAIYKLIEADLKNAIDNGNSPIYSANSIDLGHANAYAAKALLAKVYLTLNRKSEASILLQDVINSNQYALQSTYANVFSVNNEMNSEIIFAIRFKGGGLGMGNPLPNNFAPTNSGNAVINGDGDGYNSPTTELLNLFVSSAIVTDKRRVANIGEYAAFPGKTILSSTTKDVYLESVTNIKIGQFVSGLGVTGSTNKVKTIDAVAKKVTLSSAVNVAANTILSFYNSVYPNKYMSPTLIAYDAENDWPVLRYSDVLLMKAEADGKDNPTSLSNINLVHQRAGLPALINSSIDTSDKFEKVLSLERRLEFAFENQRWFDLLRYNVTFQNNANKAEAIMDAHFANTYSVYQGFSVLPISLAQLQANANPDRFLLPIPQYEIDTNSFITIPQNPSY